MSTAEPIGDPIRVNNYTRQNGQKHTLTPAQRRRRQHKLHKAAKRGVA